jgi:hypothetical protein
VLNDSACLSPRLDRVGAAAETLPGAAHNTPQLAFLANLRPRGGCSSVPPVKTLTLISLLAFPAIAFADVAKTAPSPTHEQLKMPREARVFVLDKEAPSLDKTVALTHSRPLLKNK